MVCVPNYTSSSRRGLEERPRVMHSLAAATRPGGRSFTLLGATLAAALALFFCIGHASHAPMGMGAEDMIVHGLGVCLLVVIVLTAAIIPARPVYRITLPPSPPALSLAAVPSAVPAAPARASPAWLQRFRD